MKINKEILKNIYTNNYRITSKQIQALGIDCIGYDEYRITNLNSFMKNFWSKLTEEQKATLFLTQLIEYSENLNDLKDDIRNLENKIANLSISY